MFILNENNILSSQKIMFNHGWQEESFSLAEKKRYCEMIKKGASRSTVSEFYPSVFKRSWINTGLVKPEEFD